jgi:hypothetical protein
VIHHRGPESAVRCRSAIGYLLFTLEPSCSSESERIISLSRSARVRSSLRDKPKRISHSFEMCAAPRAEGPYLPETSFTSFLIASTSVLCGVVRDLSRFVAEKVRRIAETLQPFRFDRVYDAWWDPHIPENAKAVLSRSVDRNLEAIAE